MKVVLNKRSDLVNLNDLNEGDMFLYKETLYLRIAPEVVRSLATGTNIEVNAAIVKQSINSSRTGTLVRFSGGVLVQAVHTLTVDV